jgi:hypothetical protein
MNYSTAVFLINDAVRCIAVTYEEGEKATRTLFKTLDPSIKVGEFVIVPTDTRHKMTVVKVAEVDLDPDLDSPVPMNWIIGVVERADYESLLKMEADAIETIKSAEKRKKRDEMREAIFKDRSAMLNGLQLTNLGGVQPIEPPVEAPPVRPAPPSI